MERDNLDIREMLSGVPGSYEDFVRFTSHWMEEDSEFKDEIIGFIYENPEADSSDVLELVCDYLGFGEPLEIVDDEEEFSEDVQAAAPAFATVG